MALSKEDLDTRANDRAAAEHLHTFKLAGGKQYLVKSRKLEPGAMHVVTVDHGTVTECSNCPGWHYRGSCTHAAAVERRLEREGKATKPATDSGAVITPIRGRSQLFREED